MPLDSPSSVAFTPDGGLLVTSAATIRTFTIADDSPIEELVFIDSTGDEQFDISDVAFLAFKPLP